MGWAPSKRALWKLTLLAAWLWLGASLSGCVPGDDTRTSRASSDPGPSESAIAAPHYSGPWAEGFASAYRDAHSDFERKVLEDGKISDAEFDEMQNKLKTCLNEQGIDFTTIKSDGSFGFKLAPNMASSTGNKIVDECDATSGFNTIGFLYLGMQRNPQNLPDNAIIARCLVKNKAVPPNFSTQDYDRDAPNSSFPFLDKKKGPGILAKCSTDPLDILKVE